MRASRAWATGISRWRPSHSPTTSSATRDSALLSGAQARSRAAKRAPTRPEGRHFAYSEERAGPPRRIGISRSGRHQGQAPTTVVLDQELADSLTARAIRAGKNLEAVVAEILQAALS